MLGYNLDGSVLRRLGMFGNLDTACANHHPVNARPRNWQRLAKKGSYHWNPCQWFDQFAMVPPSLGLPSHEVYRWNERCAVNEVDLTRKVQQPVRRVLLCVGVVVKGHWVRPAQLLGPCCSRANSIKSQQVGGRLKCRNGNNRGHQS